MCQLLNRLNINESKPMIPSPPPKEIKIHSAGEAVESGIVIMAKHVDIKFAEPVAVNGEKASRFSGELRIVHAFFGFEKYRVEMNGHMIYCGEKASRFESLAEAAEFASF